jgi:hypothetical protein
VLSEIFDGHAYAYLGTVLPDCPNAFITFGPNTYSFSSAFEILEAQLKLIVSTIKVARKERLATVHGCSGAQVQRV